MPNCYFYETGDESYRFGCYPEHVQTKTVTIRNRAGLHTRPAAAIVKLASKYRSEFYLIKDGFRINGKSIIGVMTLAAAQGSQLTLEFDGSDEEPAMKELSEYFEKGFEEEI
jgi:phosphocarrier protein